VNFKIAMHVCSRALRETQLSRPFLRISSIGAPCSARLTNLVVMHLMEL
jgi:hypothetical protein